jgi:hypothetical protein
MDKEELENLYKDFTSQLVLSKNLDNIGLVAITKKQLKQIIKIINHYTQIQSQLKKQKEVIDKANKKLNNFIGCCKAEKLESGSDYIHHQYWDMFERFNKQIKGILKEASECNK